MNVLCKICQEKQLRLQNQIEKFAIRGHELFNRWEEKSREFIANFLALFGREGRIVSVFFFEVMGEWLLFKQMQSRVNLTC